MGRIGSSLVTSSLGPVAIVDSLARRHPQWASALAQGPGPHRVPVGQSLHSCPGPREDTSRHAMATSTSPPVIEVANQESQRRIILGSPDFHCVSSVGCIIPSGGEAPRPDATESSVFTAPGISPLPYSSQCLPDLTWAYTKGSRSYLPRAICSHIFSDLKSRRNSSRSRSRPRIVEKQPSRDTRSRSQDFGLQILRSTIPDRDRNRDLPIFIAISVR
jgi:hypothetical protein